METNKLTKYNERIVFEFPMTEEQEEKIGKLKELNDRAVDLLDAYKGIEDGTEVEKIIVAIHQAVHSDDDFIWNFARYYSQKLRGELEVRKAEYWFSERMLALGAKKVVRKPNNS